MFFSLDFFSGARGSDLGRIKSSDVLVFKDGKGYLINQVFGKTLRGNSRNVFGVKPVSNSSYCPVKNLSFYISLAKIMSIDLKAGYLFRVCDHHNNIIDVPSVGSAVENRLKKYLKELSLDDGETMHSFRSGCSITLSLLGISYKEIAQLVGWKSVDMATYNSQYDKVMSNGDASSVLSCAAKQASMSSSSIAELKGKDFRDRNHLKGYEPLFH